MSLLEMSLSSAFGSSQRSVRSRRSSAIEVGGLVAALLAAMFAVTTAHAQPAGGAAANAAAAQPLENLKGAIERPVDVENLRLELDVQLLEKRVAGSAELTITPLRNLSAVTLNAIDHEVSNVWIMSLDGRNRQAAAFENTGKELQVSFAQPLAKGGRYLLTIEYQVRDPKAGLHFFAPSDEDPNVRLMVWSQGEPTANRYWFPSFDHPNERQSSEMIVTTDPGFEAISNGKLLSREPTADRKRVRFHWKQEKSHVSYLVTLVVGKFAIGEETWRGKPVVYYAPPDRAADIKATFGRTLEMLDFFSERFGIEYPWEKYAQVVVEQFTSGGMENTSATTLVDHTMHDERALIDSTPDWLIAHELGHQWWGDLVTCKDWAHLWLNEGFASYCEILWAEHKLGKDERDYRLVEKHRLARSGETQNRPIVDRFYADPGEMFDTRAYPKGAWVLHMLRSRLGDEDFFLTLKRYGTVYSYQTAESSDLRKVMEELTGYSLERFFHDWTERPGQPTVVVKTSYNAQTKLAKIVIQQTQAADAFEFPLRVELVTGSSPVVVEPMVNQKEMTLYVPVPTRPEAVRVDPAFTLLADIKEDKPRDWWEWQATKAPTIAERIRAVDYLSTGGQPAERDTLNKVLTSDAFYGVRVEAAKALGKTRDAENRDALIAGLKQPDARVRRACADALDAWVDDDVVLKTVSAAVTAGDPSYYVEAALLATLARVQSNPTVASIAPGLDKPSHREVVRQAALRGLANSHDPAALDLLVAWSKRGKPRDCRRTALRAIGTYFTRNEVSPAKTAEVLEHLIGFTKTEGPAAREGAVEALRDMGQAARPGLDLLAALSQTDSDRRVRSAARDAVQKLRSATPSDAELNRLRNVVEELRKQRQTLEDRLQKLESK